MAMVMNPSGRNGSEKQALSNTNGVGLSKRDLPSSSAYRTRIKSVSAQSLSERDRALLRLPSTFPVLGSSMMSALLMWARNLVNAEKVRLLRPIAENHADLSRLGGSEVRHHPCS